jgi:hypothetical protein
MGLRGFKCLSVMIFCFGVLGFSVLGGTAEAQPGGPTVGASGHGSANGSSGSASGVGASGNSSGVGASGTSVTPGGSGSGSTGSSTRAEASAASSPPTTTPFVSHSTGAEGPQNNQCSEASTEGGGGGCPNQTSCAATQGGCQVNIEGAPQAPPVATMPTPIEMVKPVIGLPVSLPKVTNPVKSSPVVRTVSTLPTTGADINAALELALSLLLLGSVAYVVAGTHRREGAEFLDD